MQKSTSKGKSSRRSLLSHWFVCIRNNTSKRTERSRHPRKLLARTCQNTTRKLCERAVSGEEREKANERAIANLRSSRGFTSYRVAQLDGLKAWPRRGINKIAADARRRIMSREKNSEREREREREIVSRDVCRTLHIYLQRVQRPRQSADSEQGTPRALRVHLSYAIRWFRRGEKCSLLEILSRSFFISIFGW